MTYFCSFIFLEFMTILFFTSWSRKYRVAISFPHAYYMLYQSANNKKNTLNITFDISRKSPSISFSIHDS